MPRSSLRLLVPLLLALPAAAQAPLGVGDVLPATELEGLSQTEARAFADFYGRTVLLEFFAHWCQPCAVSVPHLNELQEKFGSRGFSVVAVTSEPAAKTEPWIERHDVRYAYGYDKQHKLQQLFQFKGIPFGALIDPFGNVVWTGHPMTLEDSVVEQALAGALERPVWQWPEELRPLAKALAAREFASAAELARSLPPHEGFDLPALVRGRLVPQVERFQRLVEARDYVGAMALGERLEKGVGALPEGEPLVAGLRALRADPEIMRQVTGAARLTELETRAAKLRTPAEAESLRTDVAQFLKEQAGSKLERRAQALLDAIDRALERAKKKS